MPQGRKKPFSGKAKKLQLKAKNQRKQDPGVYSHSGARGQSARAPKRTTDDEEIVIREFRYEPVKKDGRVDPNVRYALQFQKSTRADKQELKEATCKTLQVIPEKDLELDSADFYPKELDLPKRPKWSYDERNLDDKEVKYFNDYVNNILRSTNPRELGYFELNLETWRQLWRVLEMSDIVLHIVDVRFPVHMFPPYLYEYVTKTLKKDFILVINKIDLAPAPLVAAWKNYFTETYPELHIAMFTTLPGYNLIGNSTNKGGLQVRKRRGKLRLAAEGSQQLVEICKKIVGDGIDVSSWEEKIKEEMTLEYDNEEDKVEVEREETVQTVETGYYKHEKYKDGILTIGCLGQPNVGKSSLINAIMGRKVVSVSRTPGHTKHFQTIFLTKNVRLCDCPGLVFPSKMPKTLQILMGCYPIAQVQEPCSAVQFLAERLDLPKMLKLEHPENEEEWCARDVCDAWAKRRGFFTAKAARLDTYRAANELLRMSLDGKICLCFLPPQYTSKKEYWQKHPDVELVKYIQARPQQEEFTQVDDKEILSDLSEDEGADQATQLSRRYRMPSSTSSEGRDGSEIDVIDEEDEDEDDDSDDAPQAGYCSNKFAALGEDC